MVGNVRASVFLVSVLASFHCTTSGSVRNQQYEIYRLRRQTACQRLEYTCANRECIPSYNVCDGARDCSDGSDETRLACKSSGIICPSLAFECAYGACIDRELRCNGQSDCADGSDEDGCQSHNETPSAGNSCGALKFKCTNGQCINRYDTCDGVKNCDDGSDETKGLCSSLVCPSSSFQCDYGACMEPTVKCDGNPDCPDNSDEFGCNKTASGGDKFPTPSTEGGCRLPNHPKHGAYSSSQCESNDPRPACRNTPGMLVSSNWLLKYTCNSDYSLNKDSEYSICENGVWKNELDCIKLCPALKSLSVNLKCYYRDKEVPCDRAMKPDTTAKADCKQHYKPAYVPEYSRLLCLSNGEWSYPLFHCIAECGLSSKVEDTTTNTVPLILNGTETKAGEFPWLAAIYQKTAGDNWDQQCGGTLVSPHFIVTAAHCLVNSVDNTRMHPSDLRVGLGKYSRNFYTREPSSLISEVKEVVVPRQYSGAPSFYALDIGLLDLVVSVQVTAFIMPACVDWSTIFRPAPNAEGVVAGWGKTEHGTASEVVLSARLKFIGYDQCLKSIRGAFQRYLTHDKFCAGNIQGGQVDHGDSGGGLTFINQNSQHFLIGVVSTKIPEETSFTLFTDITNREHSTWLETEKNRLRESHREL